jgi:hypothetical protein
MNAHRPMKRVTPCLPPIPVPCFSQRVKRQPRRARVASPNSIELYNSCSRSSVILSCTPRNPSVNSRVTPRRRTDTHTHTEPAVRSVLSRILCFPVWTRYNHSLILRSESVSRWVLRVVQDCLPLWSSPVSGFSSLVAVRLMVGVESWRRW